MGGELGSLQQCWGKAVPKNWELQPAPRVLVAADQDPPGKDTAESGGARG